jgi:hypothetical protein
MFKAFLIDNPIYKNSNDLGRLLKFWNFNA